MPYYSNAELPEEVRENYTERCQNVFREAFNQDYEKNRSESRAFAVGNTAAKNCMQSTVGREMNESLDTD